MRSVPRQSIRTERLLLRPSEAADAARAVEIRSDWQVVRMLSRAGFPPDRAELEAWFAGHRGEWETGTAYRFAIELDGRMVGLVDLDGVTEEIAELGYWLDRRAWGQGVASEAAAALVQFGFGRLGLEHLVAGHAADNAASGRVLAKLGFTSTDSTLRLSQSRGAFVEQRHYELRDQRNA